MQNKQKLELTWIGKENRPRLEPRILLEDPEKSYHAHIASVKTISSTTGLSSACSGVSIRAFGSVFNSSLSGRPTQRPIY